MRPACTDVTVVQAGLRTSALVRALIAAGLPLGGLVLAAGAAYAQAPCPAPTTSFAVTAEHYPPVVKSSYTSAELRALAARAAREGPHPPLGFYAGTFGYGVEAIPDGARGCAITVTVRLFLASRLVEVATDGPCKPAVIAEHYLLHARQDDLLLSRYAAQARAMLDRIERGNPSGHQDGGEREALVRQVSRELEQLLEPYDPERERALRAADTDDALARLAQGCGNAT